MSFKKQCRSLVILSILAGNLTPVLVTAADSITSSQEESYNEISEEKQMEEIKNEGIEIKDSSSSAEDIEEKKTDTTGKVTSDTPEENDDEDIESVTPPIKSSEESEKLEEDISKSEIENESMNSEDETLNEQYSIEDNRKRAMEIMEQDLKQKLSGISLFRSRMPSHVDEFIKQFGPIAQKNALENGLYPSVMLAQAALESGWNTSSLSKPPYHQLFGIKTGSHFSGDYVTVETKEWIVDASHPEGGYYITIDARFRVYPSYDNAFKDQAAFLKASRYKNVFMDKSLTYREATRALQDAGYATDPIYAQKLNSIIASYNLTQFDPTPSIKYQSHIQHNGTTNTKENGALSGTIGEAKRMEAIAVDIDNITNLGVQYSTFLEGNGWTDWVNNGQWSGTKGENRRLEAIKLKLTGQRTNYYDVYYRVHVEKLGWLDWAKNGEETGTKGYGYRIEAIEIELVPKISYSSYLPTKSRQLDPWQEEVIHGQISGTVGRGQPIGNVSLNLENSHHTGTVQFISHMKGSPSTQWNSWQNSGQISGIYKTVNNSNVTVHEIDALRVRLTGELAQKFDIFYRVHIQKKGWLDWQRNGEVAGNIGQNLRVEAYEVRMVPKGAGVNGKKGNAFLEKIGPNIMYKTHIQTIGWQDWVEDGKLAGTTGQSKRLEAIQIRLQNLDKSGGIRYKTHVQTFGWQDWVNNGDLSGTVDQSKRLEAIQLELTGDMAKHYDVYYRVHAEKHGWLGWAKNGEPAGTAGHAYRLEALEIEIVEKGKEAPGVTSRSFVEKEKQMELTYATHVQSHGWQTYVSGGQMSGTEGEAKRLEGIKIELKNKSDKGQIRYKTHVQSYGWQDWVSDNQLSGTHGEAKRLEAIQIELTDDLKEKYDIYYRVHAQSYGWLDWAKNGESAGTEGLAKRLEGIEIRLVKRGEKSPGRTKFPFIK